MRKCGASNCGCADKENKVPNLAVYRSPCSFKLGRDSHPYLLCPTIFPGQSKLGHPIAFPCSSTYQCQHQVGKITPSSRHPDTIHWVHCEYIASSETIHPHNTQWAHARHFYPSMCLQKTHQVKYEFFAKELFNLLQTYPVGMCWVLLKSTHHVDCDAISGSITITFAKNPAR